MINRISSYSKKQKRLAFCCLSFYILCYNSFASDVDIRSVNFKENRPTSSDVIEKSIADHAETMQVLSANTATMVKVSPDKFRFKIVGFTDNKECSGDACKVLSLRRAQLVYAWLLAHGVLADQLLPPEGRGSDDPIDTNAATDGRQRNRRVEFQVIPISPTS